MSLDEIYSECYRCTKCALHNTRINTVFGTGNIHADIMFVGEAPGENEDKEGKPFVGRAGKLLDKFLVAADIDRENVYITNILKCRPPKNRDPQKEEEDMCIDYLRAQVRAVEPKMIVCLGRIAAMRLIKPDYKITAEHGMFVEKKGIILTAVYHPSALLRDVNKKDDMMTDLLKIKEYAVQRGFVI